MSEYMPEDMPDRMPEDMSDRVPEDMPDRMPEDLPDRMPEDMPEDMPDHMPEDMPDRMSNRMSEDMSDRMPEDLPVRKCINVMVGITRSKVIFCRRTQFWFDFIPVGSPHQFCDVLLTWPVVLWQFSFNSLLRLWSCPKRLMTACIHLQLAAIAIDILQCFYRMPNYISIYTAVLAFCVDWKKPIPV